MTLSAVDLRCFPSADRAFAGAVQAIARDVDSADLDPETLQTAIRTQYPEAIVRPQDPLANLDGRRTWYVYRRSTVTDHAEAPDPVVPDARERRVDDGATTESPAPAAPAAQAADRVRLGDVPVYTPSAVASIVGVPLAVLVGWDDRYGLVKATRRGDRRLYSRNQVEEIRRVKREITAGREPEDLAPILDTLRTARSRRPGPPAATSRQVLVLVAEQDPFSAEFVEYLLRTEGYGVVVAYDDQEADLAIQSGPPEIAVVDVLRPDDAGLELCARLAANGVRTIAVAAIEREDAALAAGADAFLTKPIQPLVLLSVVRDLLGDSALAKDHDA